MSVINSYWLFPELLELIMHRLHCSLQYNLFFLLFTDEPMISEVQSNVVDGINLDEMKEFAKAFKLRRLSLGLTQTQVGQALSVTEGPAYSQSAICRFVFTIYENSTVYV